MHPKRTTNPDAKRPSVKDRELNEFVKSAWAAGWWCEKKGKHVKAYPPNGPMWVTIAGTPSDWRTVKNIRSKLRQAGLEI
ncbi:MAG: hypothetical protein ACR2NB_09590 [Solirubrobacteraceae bacterium]